MHTHGLFAIKGTESTFDELLSNIRKCSVHARNVIRVDVRYALAAVDSTVAEYREEAR
jgi:hypothetical protein